LSLNPNDEAIKILKQNQDKISWDCLSSNPAAIELLEENQDKIDYDMLSENPAIFIDSYNYDLIKEKFKELNEEIIMKALHPKRMLKLMEKYGEEEIYSVYFDEN
jgi:hypothetical protein